MFLLLLFLKFFFNLFVCFVHYINLFNSIVESLFACGWLRLLILISLIFVTLISRIWLVFENYSQKLFEHCQNKKNRFFDEKLILRSLIIVSRILKLIRNIVEKRLKLRLKELKTVNDRRLLKKSFCRSRFCLFICRFDLSTLLLLILSNRLKTIMFSKIIILTFKTLKNSINVVWKVNSNICFRKSSSKLLQTLKNW